MIFLLVLLTCALLAFGFAMMRGPGGFDLPLASLLAAPWLIGLAMLAVKRRLGIAVLQASSALHALFLLYPAFLSIFFIDGSLRSLSMPLLLLGCLLILFAATAAQRKTDAPVPGAAVVVAWILPVLFGSAARGLIQTRIALEDKKVLARMDFKTGDEAKRLTDCLARFAAANGQRYPADAAALQQLCASELRLSYYQVEYIVSAGGADYSMCLTPIPGASPEPSPIPWLLGPWGTLLSARGHPGSPCGYTSTTIFGASVVAATAHQCLLRRRARDPAKAPGFQDIWYGDSCLAFDAAYAVKATDTQLTLPGWRLLLLASESGDAYRPRFLYCEEQPEHLPPQVWTSRSGLQPAPAELAKLCAATR